MSTARTVAVRGLAAVEHRRANGHFVVHEPLEPGAIPVRAGDRLRVRLEVAGGAWTYAIGSSDENRFWQMAAWDPVIGPTRDLWPGGHLLTDDEAHMTTLLIVVSSEPLPWARDLVSQDCSHLLGKLPSRTPQTP